MGMVMLDRLRNINNVDLILPVKHIILTEIGVNEPTLLIE